MVDVKCKKCKKSFVPAPEHVFKTGKVFFCCWTCFNHRNDGKAVKIPRMVEVYDLDGDLMRRFASVKKAAEFMSFPEQHIRGACRTGIPYHGFVWKYKE
jgi:hypothetical protein